MTIDEAIQQARYVADEHSHCWRNCENLDKCCNECEYEHKQLAEWLEELKALRHDAHQWAKAGYAHGHSVGYNKAIDDFVNACKDNVLCKTFGLRENDIEKIAEQLKAGAKNE